MRRGYLPGKGTGGAGFFDLFAGPGRARIRETGAWEDGSPLIATRHADAPFTKVVLCDLNPVCTDALAKRTAGDNRVVIVAGDCNKQIDRIAAEVPPYGLNLAMYDPYGLAAFDFASIEKLARASERMDLLIHYPTGTMKRNIANRKASAATRAKMTKALGGGVTAELPRHVVREMETLRRNLEKLGYVSRETRAVPVVNGSNTIMYHLLYASRHPLGDKIWESITRPKVQREFALM